MSLISKLTPVNLQEEKKKFFADENYNPQFEYGEEIIDENLYKYGQPKSKILDIAQTIVNKAYANRSETELRELRGKKVSKHQVEEKINKFLEIHNLQDRFKLIWSSSFVARTAITSDTIKLRLPVEFNQLDLLSMIYHEIGTHALRRINYEKQPWFKKKNKYGFKDYLQTEEGIAILHSLLPQKFQLAYQAALNYLTVQYAQQHSFVKTWNYLAPYIDNPNRRFVFTFRKKRGLKDTSQAGGFTKDLVYLAGMIEVWSYLKNNNFDLTKLYFGKMSLEDVNKAVSMNPDFKPLLPSFYTLNKSEYVSKIKNIGKINFLG